MNFQNIKKLKELLLQLQQADPHFRVFGAKEHKYTLQPPLTEREVQAFEQTYNLRLPEDYRFFLQEAGNGGAGPYYGLKTLATAAQVCDSRVPFPFIEQATHVDLGQWEYWYNNDGYAGLLEICHQGCAYYSYLVINGPAYGTVWTFWHHCDTFEPTGLSFRAWYRGWMCQMEQQALPMLANEKRVSEVTVGMTKAQVIKIVGSHPRQEITLGSKRLVFEQLATQFELNADDAVVRIIRSSI